MTEIVGADRLASTAAEAAEALARLDLSDAGRIITAAAAATAPRATGRLAGAHTTTEHPGGVTITNAARYAIPVHQGWAGAAARPWLARAAESTQPAWLAALEDDTQKILDTIKGA